MAESTNASKQPYKYNGKEFVGMYGLDESVLGNRNLFNSICRFQTIDKFAELYPWQSIYSFAGNNPINYIDINGDTISVNPDNQKGMNIILHEIFGENSDDFYYSDNNMLIYNGNGENLSKVQHDILEELYEFISDPELLISSIIYQVSKSRAILYHAGNSSADTKGCMLPGKGKINNKVTNSKNTLNEIKKFIRTNGYSSTIVIINNSIKK